MTTDVNLVQKLAAVMGDMTAFAKTGKNTGMNFRFVEINEILIDVRPRFAAHQIIMYPTNVQVEKIEFHERERGFSTHVFLNVTWTVTDGTDSITVASFGEAIDTSDKASNKAQTAAEKQALQKLLLISNEDDNDSNNYTPRQQADTLKPAREAAFGKVDAFAKSQGINAIDVVTALVENGKLPDMFLDAREITTATHFRQLEAAVDSAGPVDTSSKPDTDDLEWGDVETTGMTSDEVEEFADREMEGEQTHAH